MARPVLVFCARVGWLLLMVACARGSVAGRTDLGGSRDIEPPDAALADVASPADDGAADPGHAVDPGPTDLPGEAPVDTSGCRPVIVPAIVNFGPVAAGFAADQVVTLRNDGSMPCTFVAARIADCADAEACPDPFAATASSVFAVVDAPLPVVNGIPGGGGVPFRVRFEAPANGPPVLHSAILGVRIRDDFTKTEVVVPVANADGKRDANLGAAVVMP